MLRIPVKVKIFCFPRSSSLWPGLVAADRRSVSGWSARSAARTNDLDADKVDRMLIGRGGEGTVPFQVMGASRG